MNQFIKNILNLLIIQNINNILNQTKIIGIKYLIKLFCILIKIIKYQQDMIKI